MVTTKSIIERKFLIKMNFRGLPLLKYGYYWCSSGSRDSRTMKCPHLVPSLRWLKAGRQGIKNCPLHFCGATPSLIAKSADQRAVCIRMNI